MLCRFFFFQAEDGIRDGHVTGVQTCALPISNNHKKAVLTNPTTTYGPCILAYQPLVHRRGRSEERRVGKECRHRRSRYQEKKKTGRRSTRRKINSTQRTRRETFL